MVDLIYAFLGALLGAILLDLARDQAKASTPLIADWLRRRAVSRLPLPLQERMNEEWAAVLNDTAGPIAKLWCAIGFLVSAPSLQVEKEESRRVDDEKQRLEAIATPRVTETLIKPYFVVVGEDGQPLVQMVSGSFPAREIVTSRAHADEDDNIIIRYEDRGQTKFMKLGELRYLGRKDPEDDQ